MKCKGIVVGVSGSKILIDTNPNNFPWTNEGTPKPGSIVRMNFHRKDKS